MRGTGCPGRCFPPPGMPGSHQPMPATCHVLSTAASDRRVEMHPGATGIIDMKKFDDAQENNELQGFEPLRVVLAIGGLALGLLMALH